MFRPIITKIVAKFQVTVPPEIRKLFDLREGDLLQWDFDEASSQIVLQPKRATLLSPVVRRLVNEARAGENEKKEDAAAKIAAKKVARAGSLE
jgi:AbrB family looped-hinge helix DNA binding protein